MPPSRRPRSRFDGRAAGRLGRATNARRPASGRPQQHQRGLAVRAVRSLGQRARNTDRPRPNLTGRAAILALTLCALLLTLAYPLRAFLDQRGEIAELRARTAATERLVEEQKAQRERWKDPEYVRMQARDRLGYVRPGETSFVVLPDGETDTSSAERRSEEASRDLASGRVPREEAWFDRVWVSFTRPGVPPPPPPDPAPADPAPNWQ